MLERMFFYFRLIDINSQAGLLIGKSDSFSFLDHESFAHDLISPRHIAVQRVQGAAGQTNPP
jgi:hypothetical protein